VIIWKGCSDKRVLGRACFFEFTRLVLNLGLQCAGQVMFYRLECHISSQLTHPCNMEVLVPVCGGGSAGGLYEFCKKYSLFYSIRWRKVTEMYCHCNDLLSLKHYNNVYHIHLKTFLLWVLVAHSCNPSYSGGRDQEDHDSNSAWTKSSWDHILRKEPSQKRAHGLAQDVGP
jgi:hypothetical protein